MINETHGLHARARAACYVAPPTFFVMIAEACVYTHVCNLALPQRDSVT